MNDRHDSRSAASDPDQELERDESAAEEASEIEESAEGEPSDADPDFEEEEPTAESGGEEAEEGSRGPDRDSTSVDELEMSLESVERDAGDGEDSSVTREDQLAAQIDRLQAESDAHRDKWLRAMAEFENFRKRTRRELDSSLNLARASVFKQLLEVVDNFERALDAHESDSGTEVQEFMKGMELVRDQLIKLLKEHDVHRIEAVGKEFDPNLHEAISQIETDEVPSEHVAQVVQEGYQLGDLVLRPAVVIVAQ